jgi:hypothetical protein
VKKSQNRKKGKSTLIFSKKLIEKKKHVFRAGLATKN